MFSHRLTWDRAENRLAEAERRRRAAGRPIVDLTESNPTCVGLPYPLAGLRAALAPAELATYEPTPRGSRHARAAIAARVGGEGGTSVDPERVLLTASSSESYSLLFKLLCDPGDAVLVPEPSYPLFDYLARLDGVRPVAYRLAFDGSWHVDLASVQAALAEVAAGGGGRPRALIVVNPNNPTGSFIKRGEHQRLAELAARAGMAIISDEVFADYATDPSPPPARPGADDEIRVVCLAASGPTPALTFSLGGLSKSCGLPQLKLGWIHGGGPSSLVADALARLELIADTYLSVATPVQLAAPDLLALGDQIRAQILTRVNGNRATFRALISGDSPCTLLPAEGGWSAILRVPAVRSDADWACALLEDDGLLVHPGYFFDMPPVGTFLVVSLLPSPDVFADAAARLLRRCGEFGG